MNRLYEISSKHIFPSDPSTGVIGSIDLNLSFIQWTGIPLIGAKDETKRFKIFIAIYGAILMTLMTFVYTGFETYDLVLSWGKLNELTQNICVSLSHFTGAVKYINTFYRRKDIIRIIKQFKFLSKKYITSKEQKEAFYWGELENKIPLMIFAIVVGTTSFTAMIAMLLNPTEIAGKIFPYRVKIPDFIPYSIQVPYMAIAILVSALQIVGVDYLNVTLINQIRFQMKTLNIAFDKLVVTGKIDFDPNKYINSLVEHHNLLLDIRKEIESIFKYPLLLQFFTSLLVFAMTGFQATVQSGSSIVVVVYFYCGCIFSELFVYCWFGNEVSEQNKTLASHGYNSSWYDFDQKYKKTLIIFLLNAQKPFYFTAGGFLDLSLVAFSGILSKSYTYIAVLRQVYAEK